MALRESTRSRQAPRALWQDRWGPVRCLLAPAAGRGQGVRLVHVQWPRETGRIYAVDNPLWDTHDQNDGAGGGCALPNVRTSATTAPDRRPGAARPASMRQLVVRERRIGRTAEDQRQTAALRTHWGRVFLRELCRRGARRRGKSMAPRATKEGGNPATDKDEPPDFTATDFPSARLSRTNHKRICRPRRARAPPHAWRAALQAGWASSPTTSGANAARATATSSRVRPFDVDGDACSIPGFTEPAPPE
jgi:hypothetical protein